MGLFSQKAARQRTADATGAAVHGSPERPQRRASQAFDRGDEFFQIELPHSSLSRTDLLGRIEDAGWRLEHADWVVAGEIVGIYLFRRDDTRVKPAAAPSEPEPISAPSEPKKAAENRTTKVRCHACGHVHSVPVTETSFVCPNCNARLRRKAQDSG
jgi:predicted RNA-binding Zn-ribbon protein involved in translation (DUF1610 family)